MTDVTSPSAATNASWLQTSSNHSDQRFSERPTEKPGSTISPLSVIVADSRDSKCTSIHYSIASESYSTKEAIISELKLLGTRKNLLLIAMYQFFSSFGTALAPGLNWYIRRWKIGVILIAIADVLATIPSTYTQLLIGYYGDWIRSRFGRRKPLVCLGNLMKIVALFALAYPPSLLQKPLFAWYLPWNIIFVCANYIHGIPLGSWIIESSANNQDYLRIRTISINLGEITGSIAGLAAGYYLTPYQGALIFAVGMIISLGFLLSMVPNPTILIAEKNPDIIPSLRSCMKTNEFKMIFINRILIQSAIAIVLSNGIFLLSLGFAAFSTYDQVVKFVIQISAVFFLAGGTAVLFLNWLLTFMDKLRIYRFSTLCIFYIGFFIFPASYPYTSMSIENSKGFWATTSLLVMMSIITVPILTMDSLFLKDLVVYDTLVTGLNRENMYQTALMLPSSLAQGVITSIPAIVLYATGFVSGVNTVSDDQLQSKFIYSENSLWVIRICSSLVISFLALLSFLWMRVYPLNDFVANKINDAVKIRGLLNDKQKKQQSQLPHRRRSRSGSTLSVASFQNPHSSSDVEISHSFYSIRSASVESQLANDDKHMFMLHFSDFEIARMLSAASGQQGIKQLIIKSCLSLVVSILALVCLCVAAGTQIEDQLENYVILYITLVVLVSLYILYESLRIMAAWKLLCDHKNQLKSNSGFLSDLLAHAADRNKRQKNLLATILLESGIQTGESGSRGLLTRSSSTNSVKNHDNNNQHLTSNLTLTSDAIPLDGLLQRCFSGYSGLYLVMIALTVVGVLGFTVLISTTPVVNPVNHHPTYSPTTITGIQLEVTSAVSIMI